jgi:hypothetical protein
LACSTPAGLVAQTLDPSAEWRTISTAHFEVHFTPALEALARRSAAQAESAYVALAEVLHPPRGRVDLVLSDDVDFTNGFATPVPTNRIVVYTTPPVSARSLRYYDDWMREVLTHELVHIFHMDRARGIWRVGQYVFGRSSWLMPNLYSPAWFSEGLAVHFESSLTSAGRANASHQRMLLRASAAAGEFPALNALSLTTTRYPGGEIAYGYGGTFLAALARAHGDSAVREFVERASGTLIPYRLNHLAREAFGTSFAEAWSDWRDSIRATLPPVAAEPLPDWQRLTSDGFLVSYPRWTSDTTLLVARAPAREVPGLYRAEADGAVRRVARRNNLDANVPHPGGGVLFAQLDFIDPYQIRSDLHLERAGTTRRLTRGARRTEPVVRADGWLVAVQGVPGTNRLVMVSPDGSAIRAMTLASLDTQWAAPRWSPDGRVVAAVRWTRGAFADIVVVDTAGALVARLTNDRAVDGAPTWAPGGDAVIFTSDRDGAPALYRAELGGNVDAPPGPIHRVSSPTLGLDHPAVSPDGSRLAATSYREGGWQLGVGRLATALPVVPEPDEPEPFPDPPPEPVAVPARGYSPWRTLRPTSWLPLVGESASGDASYGGAVNGADVIGRHGYTAQMLLDPGDREHEWSAYYRYRGLGQPVLSVASSQEWGRGSIVDSTRAAIGALHRRARFASVAATVERPRFRTHAFVSLGAEIEWRQYETTPAPLLAQLDPFFGSGPEYRSVTLSSGFGNARRPPLAISPEDGVSLAVRGQLDWLRGERRLESRSVTAVASAYRALELGGFAHHVLAARVAGAAAGGRNPALFEVGGTTGTPVTLLPGLGFGERRSLGVRGFPPGSLLGTRALVGTVEYRAPLALLHRGIWWLPVFLDRGSVAVFADAGTAAVDRSLLPLASDRLIASLGAELVLNVALQYDVPYVVRLGVGVPVQGRELTPADAALLYVRIGAAF